MSGAPLGRRDDALPGTALARGNDPDLLPLGRPQRPLWRRAPVARVLLPAACARGESDGTWVNDIHSRLNRTHVRRVVRPGSVEELQDAMRGARREGAPVSIAGGRHAMGGQQFGTETVLLDTTGLDAVSEFDVERGQIETGAGIQWLELIDHLVRVQAGSSRSWGIIQKQTGADRLCLGGALAANAHGRGLRYAPLVADVEAFTLVDAQGELRRCSRHENPASIGDTLPANGRRGA